MLGKHEVLDLDNARHSVFGVAKKLQAHGACVFGHAVHHPARAGDQAVASFFLNARKTTQKLVSDVLAKAFLAERLAGNVEPLRADRRLAVGLEVLQLKTGQLGIMDLSHVVVKSCDFQPFGLRSHHAPTGQVVQRRAPQHGFFATRVHGNVATNTGRFGRGRVHCKDKTGALGGLRHPLGDHTRFCPDRAHLMVQAGQLAHFDFGHRLQLFGVDHHTLPGQWNGAAGVAGATAARDDGQAQLDATLDQVRHLGFGVGCQHHKRVFHTPVGRVSDMADAAQPVKFDVVFGGEFDQHFLRLAPQRGGFDKIDIKRLHCLLRSHQQQPDQGITLGIGFRCTAFLHFMQTMLQGFHQKHPAFRVVQQVILQIRVALHHPDVAQHLVQHAGGPPGAPLITQFVEPAPG